MLVPSVNVPTPPSMLLLYAVAILLVFFYSTSSVNPVVQHVIPLQQFQRMQQRSLMADVLSGISDSQTPSEATGTHGKGSNSNNNNNNGNGNGGGSSSSSSGGSHSSQKSKAQEAEEYEEEEARQYMWRQRVRALRHADYMRIETLHYLKVIASAIPRLRRVWRGEDFCAWEGVTCTAIRYPIETLVDPPPTRTRRRSGSTARSNTPGSRTTSSSASTASSSSYASYFSYYTSYATTTPTTSSSTSTSASSTVVGDDGSRFLFPTAPFTPGSPLPVHRVVEDPVFTLVGLRLRGLHLYGRLPVLRPPGAAHAASPLLSAAAATALMEQRHPRARREEERRRRPINSPREPQYWPWEAADMRMYARLQNSTYEMVRYTLRRILRRLELRGLKNNHSDVQGFATAAPTPLNADAGKTTTSTTGGGGGGETPPLQSSTTGGTSAATAAAASNNNNNGPGITMMLQETLLPKATHEDIAQTVFGEIEPRLVAIQRLDVSHNPGLLVVQSVEWLFPYMQTFNTVGTSLQPAHFREPPKDAKREDVCW